MEGNYEAHVALPRSLGVGDWVKARKDIIMPDRSVEGVHIVIAIVHATQDKGPTDFQWERNCLHHSRQVVLLERLKRYLCLYSFNLGWSRDRYFSWEQGHPAIVVGSELKVGLIELAGAGLAWFQVYLTIFGEYEALLDASLAW
jgi:hypothetical protein